MNTVGVVLAAGASRRLRPHSDGLPKTLVPIDATHGDRMLTPLDVILRNFGRSGVTDVAVVVGYAADAVRRRVPELERSHGVRLELIPNDRAETWNNCYSLWCARGLFDRPVLLCNGDTVHHVAIEQALLSTSVRAGIVLAVDTGKRLGDEEMKVTWAPGTGVQRIGKILDPEQAHGEYIGLAAIGPSIADPLAAALEETWRRDPSLYYEDGFAELIRRSSGSTPPAVDVQPIGASPWIEIDDHADLARASDVLREIR